jgi:hypothetical protein
MADFEVFTGAYGYDLVIDTTLDLTGATDLKLRIKNPAGTTVTRSLTAANIDPPEEEGIVRYTVASSDFTSTGLYRLQISDETGGGKKLASNIFKLRAKASVEYVG